MRRVLYRAKRKDNGGRILSSFDTVASYDGILRDEIIGNIHDNPELKEKYA